MKQEILKAKNQLEPGQLVFSLAGRDHGRYYLIYELCSDERYVLVVDGAKRSIEKPKKKNICHLQKTNVISISFQEKLKNQETIKAEDIKQYLVELTIDQ